MKFTKENGVENSTSVISEEVSVDALYDQYKVALFADKESGGSIFRTIVQEPKLLTKMLNDVFGPKLKKHYGNDNFKITENDYEVINLGEKMKTEGEREVVGIRIDEFLLILVLSNSFSPQKDLAKLYNYLLEIWLSLVASEEISPEDLALLKYEFILIYIGDEKLDEKYTASFGPSLSLNMYVIDDPSGFSESVLIKDSPI